MNKLWFGVLPSDDFDFEGMSWSRLKGEASTELWCMLLVPFLTEDFFISYKYLNF